MAFGFGSGLSPVVPGTCGTVVAGALYLLIAQLPLWLYGAITLISIPVGNYLCGYASKTLGVHDHKGIVWDEFTGFWITLFAVPCVTEQGINWPLLAVAFVLFRFFDMVKPWPISVADKKIHGGFGIMLDDILAGVFAWVVLYLLMTMGWV